MQSWYWACRIHWSWSSLCAIWVVKKNDRKCRYILSFPETNSEQGLNSSLWRLIHLYNFHSTMWHFIRLDNFQNYIAISIDPVSFRYNRVAQKKSTFIIEKMHWNYGTIKLNNWCNSLLWNLPAKLRWDIPRCRCMNWGQTHCYCFCWHLLHLCSFPLKLQNTSSLETYTCHHMYSPIRALLTPAFIINKHTIAPAQKSN